MLDLIFEYLSYEDLKRASNVCDLWNDIAKRMLLKRCHSDVLMLALSKSGQIMKSKKLFYVDTEFGLFFNTISQCAKICCHKHETFERKNCKLFIFGEHEKIIEIFS